MFSGKEWVRVGRFHGGWRVWLPTNVSNVSMIISWFHLRRQLWFYHPPCECQVPGSASTGCFMVPVTNTASVPMIRTQSGTQMVEKGSKSTSLWKLIFWSETCHGIAVPLRSPIMTVRSGSIGAGDDHKPIQLSHIIFTGLKRSPDMVHFPKAFHERIPTY